MSRAGFTLPNVFGTKTVKGPLSDLDANFNPLKNAILDSGNGFVTYGTVGGTANALTLTNTPPALTLAAGATFTFYTATVNTGAATLNVDGLGAASIVRAMDGANLIGGEIHGYCTVVYDGAKFWLQSPGRARKYVNSFADPGANLVIPCSGQDSATVYVIYTVTTTQYNMTTFNLAEGGIAIAINMSNNTAANLNWAISCSDQNSVPLPVWVVPWASGGTGVAPIRVDNSWQAINAWQAIFLEGYVISGNVFLK